MAKGPKGIGVIGCGSWGPNHIRNFRSLPDCEVVCVADPSEAQRQKISAAFPTLRCVADYRELLQILEVDAVVVATPTKTHFSIVSDCLRAQKHVLCEKPLCDQSSDARELVRLAKSQNRVLMVGHVFLFNAGIEYLRKTIQAGDMGSILYMTAYRTNLGPIRSDVNSAFDLASHDISIFNWLMGGPPKCVSATGACFLQKNIEDICSISLKYDNDVLATIFVSWLSPKKIRQITTVGSLKMLIWDDLDLNFPITIYDKGAEAKPGFQDFVEFLKVSTWEGDVKMPKIPQGEPLRRQAQYFLECIEKEQIETSSGEFGMKVVEVLDAVAKSLKMGGAPVIIE